MERKRILIAVNTPSDVEKLRKQLATSGYEVKVVNNGTAALNLSREFQPHLVLSELTLAKVDGHHLLREFKGNASTRRVSFVMMSSHRSVDERVHTISLGVDDYITVPFDMREVVSRIKILLEESESIELSAARNSKGFAGNLCDMNIIETAQALEIGKKSGVLVVLSGDDEGVIFIRDGEIVDVEMAEVPPAQALFRMFTWSDGTFRFDIEAVEQPSRFDVSTADLIKRGMVYKDRWDQLCQGLPSLQTSLTKNKKNGILPRSEDEKAVLSIVNGNSKTLDLVKNSELDDLRTLKTVIKLFNEGRLKESPPQALSAKSNFNGKLSKSPNSRITRLVGSFLHSSLRSDATKFSSRIDRFGGSESSRGSHPSTISNQIHLNKSELLMIREKLLNRGKG